MGKKATKIGFMMCLALLLVAVPLLSACGDDDEEEGVEKKQEVVVAVFNDLSGVTAAAMAPAFASMRDAFRYANEVEGGIDGAKIVLRWVDTQSQISKTISGFKRVMAQEPKPVIANFQTVGEVTALKPDLEKAQLPALVYEISREAITPPGQAFAMMTPNMDTFAAFVDYIMENWTEDRPPKLAHLGPDDPWGRTNFGAFPYAEEKGMEIKTEFMPHFPVDTTAQLMRIRSWEADFVYIHDIQSGVIPVLKDAERLGMIGEVQFLMSIYAWPYDVMDAVGEAADGVWMIGLGKMGPDAEGTAGNERAKKVTLYIKGAWDPQGKGQGSVYGDLVVAVLRAAAAEVGVENLDAAAVYNVLDRGFEWDPGGTYLPFRFGPDMRVGAHTAVIYELRDGEVYPLTGLIDAPHLMEP